mmetsp:Transcript_32735/g.29019  ORF Transcript_32735/g.29019 Transcript_32735/m.29019 type:complete len:120 (-) Transcript_32735:658-1017(-)
MKEGIKNVNFEGKEWDIELSHLVFKILINMFLGKKFEENVEIITNHTVEIDVNNISLTKVADSNCVKTTKSDFIDYYIETTKQTLNPFTASVESGPSENLEKIKKAVFEVLNFKEPDIN